MFFWRLKNFLLTLTAVAFTLVAACAVKAGNVCKLQDIEGERTFYLNSPSSQALQAQTLRLSEFFSVKGESVCFTVENTALTSKAFAETVAKRYHAEILFCENACGVSSYYGYTPLWKEFVVIDGRAVNLQIAIQGRRCVVGTPIIFGGF